MNIPEYLETVQRAVNEYEQTCAEALLQMKQDLIDARKAFIGDVIAPQS